MMHCCRSKIVVLLFLLLAVIMPMPARANEATITYQVHPGETLTSIAQLFGTDVGHLMQLNGLRAPNFIWVGKKLIVPQPVAAPAPAYYVVRVGDTLSSIALRFHLTVPQLMTLNDLRSSHYIWIGQRLRVQGEVSQPASPPGEDVTYRVHIVQWGETLAGIAAQYNVNPADIIAANSLRNANYIWAGQKLRIPQRGGNPLPPPVAPHPISSGKWIDVNVTTQRIVAYEGSTPVFSTSVSGGTPAHPTVLGTYHIYLKLPSQRMTGPGYDLPNVPWVMYFYSGYSFHGTYWHHNFGYPMSHGCLNMRTPEAQWLYQWAPLGTAVYVHQ